MKPPKILSCPRCHSSTAAGIVEGRDTSCFKKRRFRVGCTCGWHGPWAVTVRVAIEVWNDRSL